MAVEIALPALTAVLITAAVDSINPCAIGVLVLLVSTLIAAKRKGEMLRIGVLYISAIYLTYFAFGLGLTVFLSKIPIVWAEYISIAVGFLVVLAGLVEIKDYFWYGKGFTLAIPEKQAEKIQKRMRKLSLGTVIFLGMFVAAVELPCTGGPYLAITMLLSQNFNLSALVLLLIYNFIFVLPLIVILALVLLGTKIHHIHRWKQSNKALMRLATGLLLVGLGWLLMLIANGTINLN
ncbi:MAG: GAP family protein [Nanoarchaeota archaeon]|nr:GAP family protein [Nanoarchaeota archaeon]